MKIAGNVQLKYLTELSGYVVDTGSADSYVVALDPAITSYTTGLLVKWQATNDNTGASTLDAGGGAVSLKKNISEDLDARDIKSGGIYICFYDGANFQMYGSMGGGGSSSTDWGLYQDYGESSPFMPTYTILQVDSSGVWADGYHDGVKLASVGHRLFILGGWNGTLTPITTDLIRYSDDNGVTWADWGTALPYATHSMIVIQTNDGWWYLIGADSYASSTERKTVHRTKDFVTFDLRTNNAEWASSPGGDRVLAAGVALEKGRIAVMGGQNPTGWAGYDDIWISDDGGVSWIRDQSSIVVGGNHFLGQNIDHCVVRRGDKIYVIGGGVYDDNPGSRTYTAHCYVASIYDLSVWTAIADSPSGGRQYASCALWDGKIWQVNGVDSSSTNQYGTVYLDKNNTWHDINDTYRSTRPGQFGITHATAVLGANGSLFRVGGNGSNTSWRVVRSIYQYPEAPVPFYGDLSLGAVGTTYAFGVNVVNAGIPSGTVLDVRGGKGRIENDSYDAFLVSTSTTTNNITGIGVYGGYHPVYMFSGGNSGTLQKRWGIYMHSNNVPLTVFEDSENVMIAGNNASASPLADNGYRLQVMDGGIYLEDSVIMHHQSADLVGSSLELQKHGTTGNINGAVVSGTDLGKINWWGYDGNGGGTMSESSRIAVTTTQDWDATNHGSKMLFYTTPNASTTPTLGLLINQDQQITLPTYGSGTYSGTEAYRLAVDSSGNVIEVLNVQDVRVVEWYDTSVNNTGTGETDLYSYEIGNNLLNLEGQTVYGYFAGTFNDNTATPRLRVYLAGNSVLDTGALTIGSTGDWKVKVEVMFIDASNARVFVEASAPATSGIGELTKYTAVGSLDFTNPTTLKITGTATGAGGGSNDITATMSKMFWATTTAH